MSGLSVSLRWCLAILVWSAAAAQAAEKTNADQASGDHELAQKLNNPVSSLISVPFQFNYDCCYGPRGGSRTVMNLQPVIPVRLDDDLNVIVRTIMPFIAQGETVAGAGSHFGLGDITQSFFFTPKSEPGEWIWGAGPAFLWPTASDPDLGSRKWGAGPTAILLKQDAGWTYGVLANHIWSYSGERERTNVNSTFFQPFLSHTWPDSTNIGLNTESTYDWQGQRLTLPINLTAGHLFRLAGQPINLSGGIRYTASARAGEAQWGGRLTMTLLFPE
jgi:hypothetical protein